MSNSDYTFLPWPVGATPAVARSTLAVARPARVLPRPAPTVARIPGARTLGATAHAGRDRPVRHGAHALPRGKPARARKPARQPGRGGPDGSSRGFSLVELLVVLVILGLLIGIVAPNFMGRAEQSRGEVAKVQIESLHSALKTYRLDVGRYPSTEEGLASLLQAPPEDADYWHGPYLDKDLPLDPWRNPYQYRFPVNNLQGLALYSFGADGAAGGEGDNADIGYLPDESTE